MKVSAEEARSLGRIMDTLDLVLQHRPDLPGALIGNDALVLCFIPNRTNPSPHYVNWFGLAGQAAKQQRWSYIQAVRPLLFFHKASWGGRSMFSTGGRTTSRCCMWTRNHWKSPSRRSWPMPWGSRFMAPPSIEGRHRKPPGRERVTPPEGVAALMTISLHPDRSPGFRGRASVSSSGCPDQKFIRSFSMTSGRFWT